jgi:hypothetical protein
MLAAPAIWERDFDACRAESEADFAYEPSNPATTASER